MIDCSALQAWGEVELIELASGGARNEVWFARLDGRPCVVRRSTRNRAALDWELDTTEAAQNAGVGVPGIITTRDGERTVDGLVVHERVDGRHPSSSDDWRLVRAALERLHAGVEVPQRPGFGSAADLLDADRAGDVDLTVMPTDAVELFRRAWSRLQGQQNTVVHGDPGAPNILITPSGAVLLDWDECRVDVPLFDLAALPREVSPLSDEEQWVADQAASAWEAAISWTVEPDYARRRLAEVAG